MNFPADKNKILEFVRGHHVVQNKEKILDVLSDLGNKPYRNVSDVTTSVGLVYK
jgi:hypothetical protein